MTTTPTRVFRGAAGATAAAFALSGLVAVGASPAQAAFDPSCTPAAPALKTLTIKPGKVNVKKKQRVITISGTTTGPALSSVTVIGEPVGKGPTRYGSLGKPKKNSFSVKVKVPKGAAKGKHDLTVSLSSKTDTYNYYDAARLTSAGFASSFNVVSKPDLKAPTIKKIAIRTKKVNTTKKAAKVNVTAKLGDKGGSGLDYAWVEISNGQRTTGAYLRKKKGTWSGTATFPKWAGNKKASVVAAAVSDKVGNTTTYGGNGGVKLKKALKAGFKVKSKTDKKNPVVSSAKVAPASINTRAGKRTQVTYTVKAKDGQSGIATVNAKLVQVGGSYPAQTGWTYGLSKKKGTYTAKGVVDCNMPAGTYAVEVDVTDNVGRTTTRQLGSVTIR